ncbi:hypothetical protein MP638_006842 [Amoeboaphelidium occidentale]|nr:hypothetical protein MP638_006842 [Amoeboaphelidium occidentale]
MASTIQVNWQGYRMKFVLPLDKTSLGNLQKTLHEATGVPLDKMKLLYSGVMMKDLKSTLASYGIRNGSKIILMGSTEALSSDASADATSKPESGGDKSKENKLKLSAEEKGLLSKIESSIANLPRVLKDVNGYREMIIFKFPELQNRVDKSVEELKERLSELSTTVETGKENTAEYEKYSASEDLVMLHRYVMEMLERVVLGLDGVQCPSQFMHVRGKRKEMVKYVQIIEAHLDSLKKLVIEVSG